MLTEKTLDQILGVLELTAKHNADGLPTAKAYQKSVKDIAHKDSVRYQTIADGCRRRLNLDNINEFIELVKEWLGGQPQRLKALLIKNIHKTNEYKVNNFFADQISSPSSIVQGERKVEDSFEVITLKVYRDTATQLRALAEAEGKTLQDLATSVMKKYVDEHYVVYVKNLINSLPSEHREQVIATLTKNHEPK